MSSIPGWGTKIPYAVEQLSLDGTELVGHNSRICGPQRKIPRDQRKTPLCCTKTRGNQINKDIFERKNKKECLLSDPTPVLRPQNLPLNTTPCPFSCALKSAKHWSKACGELQQTPSPGSCSAKSPGLLLCALLGLSQPGPPTERPGPSPICELQTPYQEGEVCMGQPEQCPSAPGAAGSDPLERQN